MNPHDVFWTLRKSLWCYYFLHLLAEALVLICSPMWLACIAAIFLPTQRTVLVSLIMCELKGKDVEKKVYCPMKHDNNTFRFWRPQQFTLTKVFYYSVQQEDLLVLKYQKRRLIWLYWRTYLSCWILKQKWIFCSGRCFDLTIDDDALNRSNLFDSTMQ